MRRALLRGLTEAGAASRTASIAAGTRRRESDDAEQGMAGDDMQERRPDEVSAGHMRSPPHSAHTLAGCGMWEGTAGGRRVQLDDAVHPVYIRPRTDRVRHAQGALAPPPVLAEPAPHGPPFRDSCADAGRKPRPRSRLGARHCRVSAISAYRQMSRTRTRTASR